MEYVFFGIGFGCFFSIGYCCLKSEYDKKTIERLSGALNEANRYINSKIHKK